MSRVLLVVVLGCAVLLGGFISGAIAGDVALGVATTETFGATTETDPGPVPTTVPDPDPAPPPAPASPPPAPASSPPPSQPASPAMSSAAKKGEPIPRKRRRPQEPPPRASHPLRAMPRWAVSGGLPERPTGAVSVLSPETAADSQSTVSARAVLPAGLLALAVVAVLLAFKFALPLLARLPVSDDTRLQLAALLAALPIVLAIGFLVAG